MKIKFPLIYVILLSFLILTSIPAETAQIFETEFKTLQREKTTNTRKPYSGNTKTFKYHSPECIHYNCKNCTRYFKTAKDAEKAGYVHCAKCGG